VHADVERAARQVATCSLAGKQGMGGPSTAQTLALSPWAAKSAHKLGQKSAAVQVPYVAAWQRACVRTNVPLPSQLGTQRACS